MDLKDFVKQALVDITSAVEEAKVSTFRRPEGGKIYTPFTMA